MSQLTNFYTTVLILHLIKFQCLKYPIFVETRRNKKSSKTMIKTRGLKIRHFHFSVIVNMMMTILFSLHTVSVKSARNTITVSTPLTFGETIVSPNGVFELGFFNPGNLSNFYIGIWYKNVPEKTVVWVANRDRPITNSSNAVLLIDGHGNLVLSDQFATMIWSSNQTVDINPIAELFDSGNFVLRRSRSGQGETGSFLWQSFDHPTDTLLPGMKLGWDLRTGLNRYITAWKSVDDPSTGPFSFKLEFRGFPEIFMWNGKVVTYRSGPWNGLRFSGVPEMKPSTVLNFSFVTNQSEVYYMFTTKDWSVLSRLIVNPSGILQRFLFIETTGLWNQYWYAPKDQCDDYRECGVYGICDPNESPVCMCLPGYEPKNLQAWSLRDGSDGCVRKEELKCGDEFGFLLMKNVKVPKATTAYVNRTMTLQECYVMCRNNCSCTAYGNTDITGGGSGCATWTGVLMDIREYTDGGQHLYVRLAASDLESIHSSKTRKILKIVGIALGISAFLCGLLIYALWRRKRKQRNEDTKGQSEKSQDLSSNGGIMPRSRRTFSEDSRPEDLELPLFDFETVAKATDDFSVANKVGQGGFGVVYKGMLPGGEKIAVKRLSKTSGQGIDEFINEVKLIARLQHRNLVRLLGCTIDMNEKMLIYEYMQNRGLDSILFRKEENESLKWQERFNIICGIARGLLYLHQDSRFRIIHRDLKASNILLDEDMNPKISDFGMARIFERDQCEDNTRRIVGTYGYMSPEYAMDGLFSIKSDVFSFGVLVLEIISGKKNRGFHYANNELNLLGYAWKLWKEENGMEFMDESALTESCSANEVLRCIHVGLLCVQERAEDRPTMASVVLMLGSETATMRQPRQPGFCMGMRNSGELYSSSSGQQPEDQTFSVNQVTMTILDAR